MRRAQALLMVLVLWPAIASAREWLFDVTLDGLSIGTHRFALREDGASAQLTSDASFRVRLLVVDAYKYEHHADETWQGDCLVAFDSRTIEQGKTTRVAGRMDGDSFIVERPDGRETLARCPMTFAYWNPAILRQKQLINPQTGIGTPVTIEAVGNEPLKVRGASVEVTRHRIQTDKTSIDVLYTAAGDWVGLRSRTREGHVLSYHLR
jgi:Domain of unknown function (DUF6134)